jgi:hypothetical protein
MATTEELRDYKSRLSDLFTQAVLLYHHPASPHKYQCKDQLHEKCEVRVGHRTAQIDVELVEIIEGLWTAGWETWGSCQGDTDRLAYIQFATDLHGAAAFAEVLTINRISFNRGYAWGRLNISNIGAVLFNNSFVKFHRADIPAIAEIIRKGELSTSPSALVLP